jgi:hypothetical protein
MFLNNVFPTPDLQLRAALGQERYGSAGTITVARVSGEYSFTDTNVIGLLVSRESLLSPGDGRDPRTFNRIVSIGGIGPAFRVERLEGFVEAGLDQSRLRTAAGVEWYQDGNRRLFSYLHYEVPLKTGVRHWLVVRPNVYVESFPTKSSFYFSPQQHATVGTMVHFISAFPRWTFEFEVNPQLLRTDGLFGYGAHGVARTAMNLRRLRFEGDSFIFLDALTHYRFWHAGARVVIPFR